MRLPTSLQLSSARYQIHQFSLDFVPSHKPVTRGQLRGLQKFIDDHKSFLVLTGAGVSTESGIPDYRSEAVGRFARSNHKPITIQQFLKTESNRQRYWARSFAAWPQFRSFNPNENHRILADWEQKGKISWLVTQNVDHLHLKAGGKNVTELHGSLYRVRCLDCRTISDRDELQSIMESLNRGWAANDVQIAPDGDVDISDELISSFKVPKCGCCGGVLKPDVTFFGDNVDRTLVDFVSRQVSEADALLVLGSSLQVFSAFRIVVRAVDEQKPIGIVNIGHSRGDEYADVIINGRCGDVLPHIKV